MLRVSVGLLMYAASMLDNSSCDCLVAIPTEHVAWYTYLGGIPLCERIQIVHVTRDLGCPYKVDWWHPRIMAAMLRLEFACGDLAYAGVVQGPGPVSSSQYLHADGGPGWPGRPHRDLREIHHEPGAGWGAAPPGQMAYHLRAAARAVGCAAKPAVAACTGVPAQQTTVGFTSILDTPQFCLLLRHQVVDFGAELKHQ